MATYEEKIIELQRAKEAGEVVVTTERGDQVIAHVKNYDNVLLHYNHAAQTVTVEEYKPGTLNRILKTTPSDPVKYGKILCEKYRNQ